MSNRNFFALLDDDETDEPQAVIARAAALTVTEKPVVPEKAPAKPKSAPLPNASPREIPSTNGTDFRGGRGSRGGRGRGGRGGRGGDRQLMNVTETVDTTPLDTEKPASEGRGSYRGRGGYRGRGYHGERDDRRSFRREFDRHSGSGRGQELKREGAGRGNWGVEVEIPAVEVPTEEKEPQLEVTEDLPTGIEETKPEEKAPAEEQVAEKVEEEPKEMTLDEYEKILEEKRKQLLSDKPEIRKVELHKDLESMVIVKKATEDELIFAKLGEEKERKRRSAEDEKKPKAININEFLKPAEGETYYPPRSNRGRGRGRGRGGYGTRANGSGVPSNIDTGDQTQFPSLGA